MIGSIVGTYIKHTHVSLENGVVVLILRQHILFPKCRFMVHRDPVSNRARRAPFYLPARLRDIAAMSPAQRFFPFWEDSKYGLIPGLEKRGRLHIPHCVHIWGNEVLNKKKTGIRPHVGSPHVSMFGPRVNVIEVASPAITAE